VLIKRTYCDLHLTDGTVKPCPIIQIFNGEMAGEVLATEIIFGVVLEILASVRTAKTVDV
jgi:hypothetical protein